MTLCLTEKENSLEWGRKGVGFRMNSLELRVEHLIHLELPSSHPHRQSKQAVRYMILKADERGTV